MSGRRLDRIVIQGYKSIADCDLQLRPINVLVGPNGAGKSNFVSAFGLLGSIVNEDLQLAVARAGGGSTLLHGGPKRSQVLRLQTYFGSNQYEVRLVPGSGDELLFEQEVVHLVDAERGDVQSQVFGSGARESNLMRAAREEPGSVAEHCLNAMRSWSVFHFHDTSAQAGVKQKQQVDDNDALRSDASNIAPFLYRLREVSPGHYERIVDSVRMVAPFFRDFRLSPDRLNSERIQLEWRQVGSDSYYNAHALSDGTLRFISLSVLLLQPDPPPVIVIDEPELGLHPSAITQLAGMLIASSTRHQLIVSTQSVTLLNQLAPEDIVIVEQHDGASTFERPDMDGLQAWLAEYAVGELWEKNVLGGRPY